MVICDITIVMVLGCLKPRSYKTVNCVWTSPLTSHFPASLPLFGPPFSPNLKIKAINNLRMDSHCSSERKSHIPLTLNQKLE